MGIKLWVKILALLQLKRLNLLKASSLTEELLPTEKDSKLEVLIPKELPYYRFQHPYGSISVYCPTAGHLSPERIYLLLEQAKHDLLAQHLASIQVQHDPEDTK